MDSAIQRLNNRDLMFCDVSDHLPIFTLLLDQNKNLNKTSWLSFRDKSGNNVAKFKDRLANVHWDVLGTLRFATARGYYGYIRSKSLPVTSPRELQYGFPPVASFSAASNCLLCRTLHYVSINCHFFAILKLILLF